jgi:outer membrane protein OmpA-like peptidoglycan-associated protein
MLCFGLVTNAQDVSAVADHPLFPKMKGFTMVEHNFTEPASYMFLDESGKEMIVSGRLLYYYYESETDVSPAKILAAVPALAKEKGAKFCSHDGNKLCLLIQQDNVEVWADLSAGDFYYTLRIIERAEVKQEVSAATILADLSANGESVLYIRFSYRGDQIQPYSMPAVMALAEVLKSDEALNIEISGHTDSEGSELDNRRLSLDRAMSIGAELTRAGIDGKRITCTGMGEGVPVADTETPEGKALNRRIVIHKK